MGLVAGLDELGGDAHAPGVSTHAAFEEVGDAQVRERFARRPGAALVLHGGGPRDDAQVLRIESA